jgi:hypothetical protein
MMRHVLRFSGFSGIFGLSLLGLVAVACVPGEYYVDTPPPPPQTEVVGVAPYPGAIYVDGYWAHRGGRYTWQPGYWDRPRPNRIYRPHRWEQRGNRYYYQRGGWYRR